MTLRRLQIVLWTAAIAALTAFVALRATDGDRMDEAAASFRPTFALADSEGVRRRSEEFRGRFLLVFFGFSNCPDICPTTMSEVAQVMDDLGADADRVQPLFISVDPERDRRLGLADYTAAFHPSILGLAGDDASTAAAASSFRIFFERADDPAAPDGYTMSHSPALYLVGPDGRWLRQFSYGTPATEILVDLKARL